MERATTQERTKFTAITPRGIKFNSHWLNSEDGECDEIINLRYKAGSWQDIKDKLEAWSYNHGCSHIHYHPLNDTESSTGDDTTFFFIGIKAISDKGFEIVQFLPDESYMKRISRFDHVAGQIVSYNSTPANGGTGYSVLDELTISTGNGDATCVVTGVQEPAGIVTSFAITEKGSGYTTGTKATTGGTGNGFEIEVLEVDAVTETFSKITHLNNILIVYTDLNVYFFLWDYDNVEYKRLYLPQLPIMSLKYQENEGEFQAKGTQQIDVPNGIDYDHGDFRDEGVDMPDYYSKTLDFIGNKKKENSIVESYVMVVCAYRLFDNSYIMHSQPLLSYVGRQIAYLYFAAHKGSDPGDYYINAGHGFYDIYNGRPVITIDNSNFTEEQAHWKGLIQEMTIFMVRPWAFYAIPQTAKGYTWKVIEEDTDGSDMVAYYYMPQSKGIKEMLDDPVYYRVNSVSWDKLVDSAEAIELELGMNSETASGEGDKDSAGKSSFYLPVDNFSHHWLLAQQSYVFNRRLHQGNLKVIFGDADAHLFTDKYFHQTAEGNGYTLYNGDLGLRFFYEVTIQTDVGKRYIVKEFSPNIFAAPGVTPGNNLDDHLGDWDGDSRSGSYSYSTSDVDDSDAPARGTGLSYYIPFMPILSYPDARAIKLRILCLKNATYYELADYTLKAHPFMNMAYYAHYREIINWFTRPDVPETGWERPEYYGYLHDLAPISSDPEEMYSPSTIETDSRFYVDENRLQVSHIDNPFTNEAKHSYQIGGQDAVILGLATSAVQVSEGQFGEFPLFVFTNEGVYTLRQGADPSILYSAMSPVSKERMLPGTLCEINSGIVYATVDGIKLLAGTELKNLSEDILQRSGNPLNLNSDYEEIIDGTRMPLVDVESLLDSSDVKTYMAGAKIAFDSYNGEIIVCNPSYTYSYVYNLRAGIWTKIDQVWDYFIMIPPKFYGVSGDSLYDLENEQGCTKNFFIQTRPMKLGSQGYKNITRLVLRQYLKVLAIASTSTSGGEPPIGDNPGVGGVTINVGDKIEGVYVFGSPDGDEYKLLKGVEVELPSEIEPILRVVIGHSHTSIRYAILVIAGVFQSSDILNVSLRISHTEISYYDNMQNKLR